MTQPSHFTYVQFDEPFKVSLARLERHDLKPGHVRVQALFTLVSTGTELAHLRGVHHDITSGRVSFPMGARGGYSFVGRITEMADDVTGWKIGQRIHAMCGHCSQTIVPADRLIAVPDALSDSQACFGIVGSISLHGVRMADVRLGHNVLVTGQGVIGQLAGQLSRIAGAGAVAVTDTSAKRLDGAMATGATLAHNCTAGPLSESNVRDHPALADGLHAAIETSGHPAGLIDAMASVNDGATIALLGCPHEPVSLDLYWQLQKRQLHLVGAYQPKALDVPTDDNPFYKGLNRRLIYDYIGRGLLDTDTILTDVVTPDRVGDLYNNLLDPSVSIAGGIDWSQWTD